MAAVDRVRGVHERVRGTAPDGRPYAASDPHLLRWVHIAEVDSFLATHQRYGAHPLDQAGRDGYVADTAVVARALGIADPPVTEAELAQQLADYRPELAGTKDARATARFLLLNPPVPAALRAPYGLLAAAAVGTLPVWTRWPLRLPYLPIAESTLGTLTGRGVVSTIRWAMTPPAGATSAPDSGERAG